MFCVKVFIRSLLLEVLRGTELCVRELKKKNLPEIGTNLDLQPPEWMQSTGVLILTPLKVSDHRTAMYNISAGNIFSFIFDLIYLCLADAHESHLEVLSAILTQFEVGVGTPIAVLGLESSAGQGHNGSTMTVGTSRHFLQNSALTPWCMKMSFSVSFPTHLGVLNSLFQSIVFKKSNN